MGDQDLMWKIPHFLKYFEGFPKFWALDLSVQSPITPTLSSGYYYAMYGADIVEKYRAEEDRSITSKISKFNIHSIGKKSSRISRKLLTSLGMETADKDAQFDLLDKNFSHLTARKYFKIEHNLF